MEEILATAIVLSGIALSSAFLFWLGIVLFLLFLLAAYLARRRAREAQPQLARAGENPIIQPVHEHRWESEAVFNPAALYAGGRVHVLYRALGQDGISRIGYASSRDGVHFDERLAAPIFESASPVGLTKFRNPFTSPARLRYDPVLYSSGGGWGGSEDPRAVEIEGRIYMTYAAFNGWESLRMMLTSIDADDFLKRNWRWKAPQFLSPQGQINKNWVLFPEKIAGRYAILHSISPRVQIAYVDDLNGGRGLHIESDYHPQTPSRQHLWDTHVRGAGAPPIKTADGWLLLYHGMDERHPEVGYKIGAMLLDLEDPTKILYRSSHPILEPKMHYENNWKRGVVYASGAVVKDGVLFVYYGGGDKTVNVATAPLEKFLRELKRGEPILLKHAGE